MDDVALNRMGPAFAESRTRCMSDKMRLFPTKSWGIYWKFDMVYDATDLPPGANVIEVPTIVTTIDVGQDGEGLHSMAFCDHIVDMLANQTGMCTYLMKRICTF